MLDGFVRDLNKGIDMPDIHGWERTQEWTGTRSYPEMIFAKRTFEMCFSKRDDAPWYFEVMLTLNTGYYGDASLDYRVKVMNPYGDEAELDDDGGAFDDVTERYMDSMVWYDNYNAGMTKIHTPRCVRWIERNVE